MYAGSDNCIPNKKSCPDVPVIGTHNGTFHCDEALACFILKTLPEYKDAKILRTRDEDLLKDCDIVVDVGGVYDPTVHRYDHHQRSFSESMHSLNPKKPWITKLSSAGLVYFHFGHKVIAQLLGTNSQDEKTTKIYDKMYENFMEEIDAIDNGISTHDEQPRYHISTHLSSRVSYLNPPWNSLNQDTDEGFKKAMELTGNEFKDKVFYYGNVLWPARLLVEEAVKNRKNVDPSGEIVNLKEGGCPWKDHLLSIEEECAIDPKIKFVIYRDMNQQWRVQCVPVRLGSFENRLSLPEEWRGLRNEELSEKSGIPDCVFVHASGFIGGSKTYEGVLEMARQTLKYHHIEKND
ncbi:UPF0160 protein MYG1, mitochondrial-like isoform X2 [Limulus polyphemus]|nr:UPF0160 protein MYG1, mitochondrial-like isoform X2 [Limulus polyphemus]